MKVLNLILNLICVYEVNVTVLLLFIPCCEDDKEVTAWQHGRHLYQLYLHMSRKEIAALYVSVWWWWWQLVLVIW